MVGARRNRWLGAGASLLFWAVILRLLYTNLQRVDLGRALAIATNHEVLPAVLGFTVLFLAAQCVRAYRFGYLLRTRVELGWETIVVGFCRLFFAGAVSPFRLGEAYRGVWIRRHADASGDVMALWLGERFLDLATLVVMFLVGIGAVGVVDQRSAGVLVGVGGLLAGGYAMVSVKLGWIRDRLGRTAAPAVVTRFVDGFGYMSDRRLHGAVLVQTVIIWALMTASFAAFIVLSPELDPIGPRATLALIAGINLSSVFSVTPGNVGGFQAVFVYLGAAMHDDPTVLAGYAILLQATNLLVVSVVAAISMLIPALRLGSVGVVGH